VQAAPPIVLSCIWYWQKLVPGRSARYCLLVVSSVNTVNDDCVVDVSEDADPDAVTMPRFCLPLMTGALAVTDVPNDKLDVVEVLDPDTRVWIVVTSKRQGSVTNGGHVLVVRIAMHLVNAQIPLELPPQPVKILPPPQNRRLHFAHDPMESDVL